MALRLRDCCGIQHISRSAALCGFLFLTISLVSPISQATIIHTSPCNNFQTLNCITGIEEFKIYGETYSLAVVIGTFANLFPDPQQSLLSWDDRNLTRRASFAIADVLNAAEPNIASDTHTFIGYPWWATPGFDQLRLFFPVSITGEPFEGRGYFDGDIVQLGSWGVSNSGIIRVPPGEIRAFGILTYVPLPSTAWLLVVAFAMLWRARVSAFARGQSAIQ
jgi:hypothetical protein